MVRKVRTGEGMSSPNTNSEFELLVRLDEGVYLAVIDDQCAQRTRTSLVLGVTVSLVPGSRGPGTIAGCARLGPRTVQYSLIQSEFQD